MEQMKNGIYDINPTDKQSVDISLPITNFGNGEAFLTTVFWEDQIEFIIYDGDGDPLYEYKFDVSDFCDLIEQHDFYQGAVVTDADKARHPVNQPSFLRDNGGGKQ